MSESNFIRAEKTLKIVTDLLEAGISNRTDVGKAKLGVSAAKGSLIKARSDEDEASSRLSQIWGDGSINIIASGQLEAPKKRDFSNIDNAIARHPGMLAAAMHYAHSKATYDLEKARRFSDVELGGGIRERRDVNETAAVMTLSIPLPFTNRNQGNIQAAKERITRAQADGKVTKSKIRMRLEKLSSDLRSSRSRTTEFNRRTVNAAEQILNDTLELYSVGMTSSLVVLDARETLYKVESDHIRAQADLMRAHNALKTITSN